MFMSISRKFLFLHDIQLSSFGWSLIHWDSEKLFSCSFVYCRLLFPAALSPLLSALPDFQRHIGGKNRSKKQQQQCVQLPGHSLFPGPFLILFFFHVYLQFIISAVSPLLQKKRWTGSPLFFTPRMRCAYSILSDKFTICQQLYVLKWSPKVDKCFPILHTFCEFLR